MYHNIAKIAWFNQFLSRIHLVRQQEKGLSVKQCPRFLVSRWRILLSDFSLLENSIFFNVPQYCQNRVVQSIFIEDSSCQVSRKGAFCEIVPWISFSRWRILLSDFSLLENSILFNVPQYCQNRVVQSIFIENSSCQVARKGAFCEIVPRISGFQVAHTIIRLLTFEKQYFLQCTTILPKLRSSINFYRGFILSDSKKRGFL